MSRKSLPSYPSERKRVLMVTSALACGGCERQMLATAEGLVSRGYHVEIFELAGVHCGQFSFEDEFSLLGIKSRRAREFGDMTRPVGDASDPHDLQEFVPLLKDWNIARLGAALEQAIRDYRPGIVHCWSDISNVVGGFVASALGVPRIVLGHRNVPAFQMKVPQAHLYREAYRRLLLNPNVVQLNNSVTNAREFEAWLGVPDSTVKVLYNGFLPRSVNIRRDDEEVATTMASIPVKRKTPNVNRTIGSG